MDMLGQRREVISGCRSTVWKSKQIKMVSGYGIITVAVSRLSRAQDSMKRSKARLSHEAIGENPTINMVGIAVTDIETVTVMFQSGMESQNTARLTLGKSTCGLSPPALHLKIVDVDYCKSSLEKLSKSWKTLTEQLSKLKIALSSSRSAL